MGLLFYLSLVLLALVLALPWAPWNSLKESIYPNHRKPEGNRRIGGILEGIRLVFKGFQRTLKASRAGIVVFPSSFCVVGLHKAFNLESPWESLGAP